MACSFCAKLVLLISSILFLAVTQGTVLKPSGRVTGNYCGTSYWGAVDCHAACPGGVDSECPPNEHCYASITCPATTANYCGRSWTDAQNSCGVPCPGGLNRECPSRQKCFADVSCPGDNPTTAPPTTTTAMSTSTTTTTTTATTTGVTTTAGITTSTNIITDRYCGTSWEHAVDTCLVTCPNGVDSECPSGQHCYADVNCNTGGTSPPSTTSSTASFIGYYELTWTASTPLAQATAGIAFSGWVDVSSALADSSSKYGSLVGEKYLSLGGGNANGRWSASAISAVNQAVLQGALDSYDGVCYDIEEGDAGLASSFESLFAASKSKGLKVLVTISHSAPYGIPEATAVMDTILSSSNVDYVSPQLYTTGQETSNDYAITAGYQWTNYAASVPKVVVSITESFLYSNAVQTFLAYGVPLSGYIVWP